MIRDLSGRPAPCGLVLAAGASARMGRPKALLPEPSTGEPFVARAVRALLGGGADGVFVVGRPGDDALQEAVVRVSAAARVIHNPDAAAGQLSSLITGIDAAIASSAGAVIVLPVDLPLVRAATVAALIGAFRSADQPIVRATHRGRHGHPVIFDRRLFNVLRRADPAQGARAVVRSHPVLEFEVDDPGVLHDVDTPGDYEALFHTSPPA